MASASSDRYVQISARMIRINGALSATISLLMLSTVWGRWRLLAIAGGLQAIVIAFNVFTDTVALAKYGRRFERIRIVFNIVVGIPIYMLIDWPLPVWLWLPYIALQYDHLDPKLARGVLLIAIVIFDSIAIWQKTPWMIPACFTALAIFCSEISRLRHGFIRGMLERSDAQRAELTLANKALLEAHEQLTNETSARKHAEQGLLQAQKLESVGRLAAGVAHEINTPVQFVGDSIQFAREGVEELLGLVQTLEAVSRNERTVGAATEKACHAADLPYLSKELPESLTRAQEGLRRVARIVRAMKVFAHNDEIERTMIDLNNAIESTLIIASNEYRYVADVKTELAELPPLSCVAGEVNQAILNLVVNAAHAIEEKRHGAGERGTIAIATRREGDDVIISVSDDGAGIPEAIRPRIFDLFFTTKPVGQGTGQGLSMVHGVAVKHGGSITFESAVGIGTTFHLRLPLQPKRIEAAA